MKKLLITTMAAVSVGLCAKAADDGFISGTSFETVPEKSYLATNGVTTLCKWYGEAGSVLSDDKSDDPELGSRYWMTEATDAQFVVSNLNKFAGAYLSNANRPQKWSDDPNNSMALYIDTDKPLMRYVYRSADDRQAKGADLNQDIFFDSVVQFTATDVAAEPDSDDKLRVWLYSSPEDVATTPGLFNETTPKKCLVVTAGSYDGADGLMGNLTHQHYEITGIDVQPDTWHRLTIKAIADINASEAFNTPGFEIWVDGTPVTYGEDKKTQFPSLKKAVANETLQCVAFDGKGAVDDIVFTTTDPFAEAEPEKFTINISETDEMFGVLNKSYCIDDGELIAVPDSMSVSIPVGAKKIKFVVTMDSTAGNNTITAKFGDTDLTVTKVNDACSFEINVENADADQTLSVSYMVVPNAGVTYPTVKPNGDSTTQETLSESAVAAIEEALAGVETMPDALTVIVNEKEYFGDEAVAKINEVVMMFKAAKEGETLKFFNDKGEMIVSFKAKNPLMETETAEATDYEAKVGETTAAVTSDYTVNKESVDLTPGVAGKNEAVTFKLVIKPVSSTGSDTGSAVQE